MRSGTMSTVAVIGSGISGAVCASILAASGASVTVFESGRGPGGRMSRRREVMEDGTDLYFDHGAPYFTATHAEVLTMVGSWEARGLVAEWKENFAFIDRSTGKFTHLEKEGTAKKFVGIPGMNSICKALCQEPGVESKFGVTVSKMDWLQDRNLWSLTGSDGKDLGHFNSVVASDKNISSPRFTSLTGRPPPLDITEHPKLSVMLQDIPVRSCFALMLAFSEPLTMIPVKGLSFKNSDILSWAFCDSSKPGRTCMHNCETWVLHSTTEYASKIISRSGLQKPSNDALANVAQELFDEFQATVLKIPRPFFMKAHRWGSAFPAIAVGGEEKCLWEEETKLAICGDFCAIPNVEGAVLSGIRAASKIVPNLNFVSGM